MTSNLNPSSSTLKFLGSLKKTGIKATKYGNTKVEKNGLEFDSKLEAEFDSFLSSHSYIKLIGRQTKTVLVESVKHPVTGETLREVSYMADFMIKYKDRYYLVDSKGFRTKDFQIKFKLMIQKYLKAECPLLLVAKSIKELEQILQLID